MASETALASKVLWEFPNASTSDTDNANMGKQLRPGNRRQNARRRLGYRALAASGYNNNTTVGSSSGDGKEHLFVLNPTNGSKIAGRSDHRKRQAPPPPAAWLTSPPGSTTPTPTTRWKPSTAATSPGRCGASICPGPRQRAGKSSWWPSWWTQQQRPARNHRARARSGQRLSDDYVGTGEYPGSTDIPGATGANASATSTQTSRPTR